MVVKRSKTPLSLWNKIAIYWSDKKTSNIIDGKEDEFYDIPFDSGDEEEWSQMAYLKRRSNNNYGGRMKVNRNKMEIYLKKIRATACPLCGNNKWNITEHVFQAIEFDQKGIILGGAAYPIVPITCANCGNTYFINAFVADLIDREPSAEENEADKTDTSK